MITLEKSSKILNNMKPSVKDFWSITPLHFLNAGDAGHLHFNFLMNMIIFNINNSTVAELNTVFAMKFHKSHGKVKRRDNFHLPSYCQRFGYVHP